MGALPFVLFSRLSQGLTWSAEGNVALFVSSRANHPKGRRNDNMTEKKRQRFAELYDEYTGTQDNFRGQDQQNIREVCSKARTWAATPERIGRYVIDQLVWQPQNGIANVGHGGIEEHSAAGLSHEAFFPKVTTMLCTAAKSNTITKTQYASWKDAFFATAGYNAHVVFNRLAFACFPTQFCSVIDEVRLRRVCSLLQTERIACEGIDLPQKDWFDLCELIVPIVREAFPDKDYADHSTFLAAIGDAV